MRARALPRRRRRVGSPESGVAPLAPAALVFLRGRDADARLRELAAARAAVRPVLGALAAALVARRSHEALGYRSLGDYGRERLGVGARCVREWARVWRGMAELPLLRGAVVAGEVGWEVARRVVAVVTPETQAACLDAVRGRTVRAVEAIVAAVRAADALAGAGAAAAVGRASASDDSSAAASERVLVRIPCTRREAQLWGAACELARRVAGEELPLWACAERMAAEAASALGAEPPDAESTPGAEPRDAESTPGAEPPDAAGAARSDAETAQPGRCHRTPDADPQEHGLRDQAFPGLAWAPARTGLPARVAALAEGAEEATARELDRRLRAAIAFLQSLDLEVGRILRQMRDRGLFAELGLANLGRYAEERLDLSPRTARRLVALAGAEHRAPAVAVAFRSGRLHALQAHVLARVVHLGSAREWVARAQRVTLRRLEDDVEAAAAPRRTAIAFRAPPEVAAFFLSMLSRAGSLERLLAHAVATWVEQGRAFRDYADFSRDGFRCTVPGCTARRNLQSHHLRFRSAGGPDAAWNRTTLCAHHHQRGVHGGTLRIRGRAPAALAYALGPEPAERFRSGDVRERYGEPYLV